MKKLMGFALVGALGACATAPIPNGTQSGSAAAVRAAEEVGARGEPQAALHLQLAHEQMDRGKSAADNGDKDRAAGLFMRAEADAELALALARASATQTEAQQALERLKTLKEGN